jgi:hypothetical protein
VSFYRNLILIFGLSILGFLIVSQGVRWIAFSPAPFHGGQRLMQFSREQLKLSRREEIPTVGLKSPFGLLPVTRKDFPPIPLSEAIETPPPVESARVSMILLQDGQKMAVVNNQVVREGDSVNRSKIVRIEADRILLRAGDGAKKWAVIAQEEVREPSRTGKEKNGVVAAAGKGHTADAGASR